GADLVETADAGLAPREDRQHVGHAVQIEPDDDRAVALPDQEAAAVRRQRADELELLHAKAEAFAIMLLARLLVGHEDRSRGLLDDRRGDRAVERVGGRLRGETDHGVALT